jgi:hypothetical protein
MISWGALHYESMETPDILFIDQCSSISLYSVGGADDLGAAQRTGYAGNPAD